MRFADIRCELLLSLYRRDAITSQAAVKRSDLSPYKLEADTSRIELVMKDLTDEGLVGRRKQDYFYLTVQGAYEAELLSQDPERSRFPSGNKIAVISLIVSAYIAIIAFLPGSLDEAFDKGCGYLHGYKIREDAWFYCSLLRDDGNNPGTIEDFLTSFWFWAICLAVVGGVIAKRLLAERVKP